MITPLPAAFAAFVLSLMMATGPVAAQSTSTELFLGAPPATVPPAPGVSNLTCQPGQVLDVLGNACQPDVTLPQPHGSLMGSVPGDLRPSRLRPLPLFLNGTDCPSGLVLKGNGEPCDNP